MVVLLSINTSPSSPTVFFPTATWLVSACEEDGACSYGQQLGWSVLGSEFINGFFNDSLSQVSRCSRSSMHKALVCWGWRWGLPNNALGLRQERKEKLIFANKKEKTTKHSYKPVLVKSLTKEAQLRATLMVDLQSSHRGPSTQTHISHGPRVTSRTRKRMNKH